MCPRSELSHVKVLIYSKLLIHLTSFTQAG